MSEPDYEFWRQARELLLKKNLTPVDLVRSVGLALDAIDVILETEPLVVDLRERVARLEKMLEDHIARLTKVHADWEDEQALLRKAEDEYVSR